MDYNFYNSIQKKKHFVSPRVPNNLRFLLLPPRNSRATSSNVSTNVIVDRPIKSLVRPRDLHCGQATRKRVRHKQGLRITIGNARVVVNASRSASRRSFLFSFPPRFLSLSSLLLFDFSLLERRERERDSASTRGWRRGIIIAGGEGRRRLRTIDRRSRIRPPLFLASWKFLSPGPGGRNTILHLNTPLLYFVPILSIRSGSAKEIFFSRRDP